MGINSKFSVSLHILTLLAKDPKIPMSSASLAASVGTNAAFVRKLMGQFSAAGLIKVERGREGGALLARSARKINLRAVYLAVFDQPLHRVHTKSSPKCAIGKKAFAIFSEELEKFEGKYLKSLEAQSIEGLLGYFKK